jgi:hypothetical protein
MCPIECITLRNHGVNVIRRKVQVLEDLNEIKGHCRRKERTNQQNGDYGQRVTKPTKMGK